MGKRKRLGEILIEQGFISRAQLDLALAEANRTGEPLGEASKRLGFITEAQLASSLAQQAESSYIELQNPMIETHILAMVSEAFARKHMLIPLTLEGKILTVVMSHPLDIPALDELQKMTNCLIEVKTATRSDIERVIGVFYSEEVVDDIIEQSVTELETIKVGQEDQSVAPIINLVDHILNKGIRSGATDIHIESEENVLRVRYRVDGVLTQGYSFPKKLQSAILTRIKILSDLNVSESRLPQDGKARFHIGDKKIDMRVSTLPSIFGEAVVIRLLDKTQVLVGLDGLGFSTEHRQLFIDLINRPNGIILVTGPTGSGKTTTLYTALSSIDSLEKNVITLEDPVEYELPMIRQSQINVKAGMTFAAGLRSILRQDPDVILIGEMRDTETAEMAVRAALTGHLVFSTLHTNDAPRAIPRLVDMEITPLLIASSVIAIIAQRLVRVICKNCKEEAPLNMELVKKYKLEEVLDPNTTYYRGKGCARCNSTGYKGRQAIFEMLLMTPEINELIIKDIDAEKIAKLARKLGMKGMLDDGLDKIRQGRTTMEEVARVVYH